VLLAKFRRWMLIPPSPPDYLFRRPYLDFAAYKEYEIHDSFDNLMSRRCPIASLWGFEFSDLQR